MSSKEKNAGGWEGFAEEPSGGTIEPSEELEQAMREAAEAVEERRSGRPDPAGGGSERAARAPAATAEPGEDDLEEMRQELESTKEHLMRLAADFENFRRRALKEREEAHAYGHQNLVKDLLPTVDNLERAIDHAAQSGGGDLEGLLQGVELVLRELRAVLAKHGVTEIEAAGQAFDPSVHEAMAQAPDASVPPNTIVQVFQKGYRLRDRLLRPARVVVSSAPEEGESAQAQRDD